MKPSLVAGISSYIAFVMLTLTFETFFRPLVTVARVSLRAQKSKAIAVVLAGFSPGFIHLSGWTGST